MFGYKPSPQSSHTLGGGSAALGHPWSTSAGATRRPPPLGPWRNDGGSDCPRISEKSKTSHFAAEAKLVAGSAQLITLEVNLQQLLALHGRAGLVSQLCHPLAGW